MFISQKCIIFAPNLKNGYKITTNFLYKQIKNYLLWKFTLSNAKPLAKRIYFLSFQKKLLKKSAKN